MSSSRFARVPRRSRRALFYPGAVEDGLPEPLRIHLDFDREAVEELLEQLTTFCARMLSTSARRH